MYTYLDLDNSYRKISNEQLLLNIVLLSMNVNTRNKMIIGEITPGRYEHDVHNARIMHIMYIEQCI